MAFSIKDWKDRPSALDPLPGETLAQWEARALIYIAANPTLVTPLNAAAMEDLETRISTYIDTQIALPTSVASLNLVRPTISGTLTTGSVLTGSPGTWSGTPFPTLTYRWLRNGTAIGSATAVAYTLVTADEGQNIVFEVTGSNGVGNPVAATSLAVVPTASGAPWTPPAGASIPESSILIGPSATYVGASIDTGVAASRNIDLQSTADVAGTLSLETSTDQSSWSTAGATVATSAVSGKQVAGLRRTITTRYYRVKYVNGATGQLVFALVRWVS
jgi:hypothetical protein